MPRLPALRRTAARSAARAAALAAAFVAALLAAGCEQPTSLTIVSGSENRTLEPIVQAWAEDAGAAVTMRYEGSVAISRLIAQGAPGVDAVWPAHSLWIALGDQQRIVADATPMLRSPVVVGLKRSIAARLGWIGRDDVTFADIRAAAAAGGFRLAMTSATQSNSGAQGLIGLFYAAAGEPDVLTLAHVEDPDVQAEVAALLARVDRGSGSSGWLKDAFVENPDAFDAMINYEAMVIEANAAFEARGLEPLVAIHPRDGVAVADSPLGRIARGDAERDALVASLQQHLLSEPVQRALLDQGRRPARFGVDVSGADPAAWRADLGLDPARAVAPAPTPDRETIAALLALYQGALRKPSATVWLLDVSGSMEGAPLAQLKDAMRLLLDPDAAAAALLQPTDGDVTIIIPFNNAPMRPIRIDGDDPAALRDGLRQVQGLQARYGTDLYAAIEAATAELDALGAARDLDAALPAIVALTDGQSDVALRAQALAAFRAAGWSARAPIHAIALGEADEAQLRELTGASVGRLFRAGDDLARVMRAVKGYN